MRYVLALTLTNLALLALLLVQQLAPAHAQGEVLRTRALEIVDARGRVRASISVLPPSQEGASEAVLLRLITERGRPSVKLGASEATSGLSFSGPTGTVNTWVTLLSTTDASELVLRGEDTRELRLRSADGRPSPAR